MVPRTENQFNEIRTKRRSEIMNTAIELFAKEGYQNTSISMIASHANVSKGLLYNYFDSKDDLLRSILSHGIDRLLEIFDPNKDGILTKEEIIYFIERSFTMLDKEMNFWRLYFSMFLQPGVIEIVHDKIHELTEPILKMLISCFENQGYDDPETEASFFGAMLDGIAINYIMNPEHFPVEKIKKKVIEMYT